MCQRADKWRLFHPINIYVYKNGVPNESPVLVHIPGDKKQCMSTVLEVIQSRVKVDGGFPDKIFRTNGTRVCCPLDLEMYQYYVVVSNMERWYKHVSYGKTRDPLVVVGKDSKNIRCLNLPDYHFNMFNIKRRQKLDHKAKFAFAYNYTCDGIGPEELPNATGNGNREKCPLCIRMGQYYDENEEDHIPSTPVPNYEPCSKEVQACLAQRPPLTSTPPPPKPRTNEQTPSDVAFYETFIKEFNEPNALLQADSLENDKDKDISVNTSDVDSKKSTSSAAQIGLDNMQVDSEHLLAFINRYRDIGGQLYQKFYERMNLMLGSTPEDEFDGKWYKEKLFELFKERICAGKDVSDTCESLVESDLTWRSEARTATASETACVCEVCECKDDCATIDCDCDPCLCDSRCGSPTSSRAASAVPNEKLLKQTGIKFQ